MRALIAALVVTGSAGCLGSPCGPAEVDVDRTIDGDTFEDTTGTRYRMLLIDAPETTQGHHDCGGTEAAAELSRLIAGQRVKLAYDDAECTDKYGRSLVWVTVGDVDVNAHLVEDGFACMYDYGTAGDARVDEFSELELLARNGHKGVWDACDPVTCQH